MALRGNLGFDESVDLIRAERSQESAAVTIAVLAHDPGGMTPRIAEVKNNLRSDRKGMAAFYPHSSSGQIVHDDIVSGVGRNADRRRYGR